MKIISTLIEAHIFRQNNDDIEFLLIKRADNDNLYPGTWQMVTGSIDENEEAYKSAIREIKEETGIIPLKFWVAPNVNQFYNQKKDTMNLIPVFAALAGENSTVKLSEEHSEFLWLKKEDAKERLLWDGQKKSVDIIYDYFVNKRNTLDLLEIKMR